MKIQGNKGFLEAELSFKACLFSDLLQLTDVQQTTVMKKKFEAEKPTDCLVVRVSAS